MSPQNKPNKLPSQFDSLPAIPSIAQKILSIRIATDEGERALLELIEKDPSIMSKIIGLANSPMFGTNRKILSLNDAVALMGTKRVKMIALSFAIMTSMTRKSEGILDVQKLWKHSLSVAMTMETLARYMPYDRRPADDEIYLSGLLHDIGFLVLDSLDRQLSDQFHSRLASESGCPMEKIEAELEISHGELGAKLAIHWGLPEPIIAVARYHHSPNDERAAVGQPLVGMSNLAGKLLPSLCEADSTHGNITSEDWQALGIDPLKTDEIITRVHKHAEEVEANNI